MKYLDITGNELKAGDFVTVAVSNYGKASLRRAMVTKLDKVQYGHTCYYCNVKTILIDNHFVRDKVTRIGKYKMGAHIGHTRRAAFVSIHSETPESVKIEVAKIDQDITKIFTSEELHYIGKTKIKLSK